MFSSALQDSLTESMTPEVQDTPPPPTPKVFVSDHLCFLISIFWVQVPNGIGTILGLVQLVLYTYYSNTIGEDQEPLTNAHA